MSDEEFEVSEEAEESEESDEDGEDLGEKTSDESDDSEDEDQADQADQDDQDDEDGDQTDLDKRVAELEAASTDRESHISDLNKALYGYRQEIKKLKVSDKEEDATFTDVQITKILDEHKDDPAVMLQVFKQVAKQQTAGIKDDAVSATEIAQTKTQIDGFLQTTWPALSDESSQEFGQLQQAKQWMRIEDHPYGDFLSMGAVMLQKMPELIEKAKEEGRVSALKEKSESARKSKINKNKLTSKGKPSSAVAISDDIKSTAAEIGITDSKQLALYAKILKNANSGQNAMTVGD